jgi:hypothetical protein
MSHVLHIDVDQFLEWLMLYFDRMQDMESEVLVYRTALEFVQTQVPTETRQTIDKIVEKTRQLPEIKQDLEKRYNEYRAQARERIEIGSADQALSQYLREWKAKGPTN